MFTRRCHVSKHAELAQFRQQLVAELAYASYRRHDATGASLDVALSFAWTSGTASIARELFLGACAAMATDEPRVWPGLPGDTVALLSRHLGARDLVRLRCASSAWRADVDADAVWAHAFAQRWPALSYEAAASGGRWRVAYWERAAAVSGAGFRDARAQAWSAGDVLSAAGASGDAAATQAAPLLITGDVACGAGGAVRPALFAAQAAHLLRVSPRGGPAPRVLRAHSGRIALLDATPCGTHLVSAAWDRTVRVWSHGEASPPRTVHALDFGAAVATALAPPRLRREGLALAAGASDGAIRVALGRAGNRSRVLRGHGARVAALTWCDASLDPSSHAGGCLLSASGDGRVKLWDVEAATCARTWHGGAQAGPLAALMLPPADSSASSSAFALAPRCLLALDARAPGGDAAAVATFAAPASVAALGLGPHAVVTGHADGCARLWDLRRLPAQPRGRDAACEPMAALWGHAGEVSAVAADAHKVVTAVRRADVSVRRGSRGAASRLAPATLRVWGTRGAVAPRAALPLCGPRAAAAPACSAAHDEAAADDADAHAACGCRCGVAALAARGGLVAAGTMRGSIVAFDWEESMLPVDAAAASSDDEQGDGVDGYAEGGGETGRFWLRAPGRAGEDDAEEGDADAA